MPVGEGQRMPRRNWIYAVVGLSGDAGNDMLLKIGDESAEPVAGRLGAPAQRRHRI